MATFRDVSERRHKPQTTSDGTLRKISDSPPKDVNTEGLPGSAFSGGQACSPSPPPFRNLSDRQ